MKWLVFIALVGLSIPLPFIGIPLLIFALWKYEGDRKWNSFTKRTSRILHGPLREDYASDEQHRHHVEANVTQFEEYWRSRELFSGMNRNMYDNGSIQMKGELWTIKRYKKSCLEILGRQPISELIEEWQSTLQEKEEFSNSIKQDFHKKAEKLKIKIIKDLEEKKDWKKIVEKYSNSIFTVSRENRVWRISYQEHLQALTGSSFIINQGENEITFSHNNVQTKHKNMKTKATDNQANITVCHHCGHENVNLEGDRCDKCYYTVR